MNERVVLLGNENPLVGILTEAADGANEGEVAVVLLNAGVAHRVGANRIHVKLARRLGEAGFPVLRFDFSGIGDSPSRATDAPFHEYAVAETQDALQYLGKATGSHRFVLMGMSSGGDIALRAASVVRNVVGVVAINGGYPAPGHAPNYRIAFIWSMLGNPRAWLRLLTGGIGVGHRLRVLPRQLVYAARRVGRAVLQKRPRSPSKMPDYWEALGDGSVQVHMVYSEGDVTLGIFRRGHEARIKRLGLGDRVTVEIVPDADHTFTLLANQERLLSIIERWMTRFKSDG